MKKGGNHLIKKLLILLVLLIPMIAHYQTSSTYACSCVQPGAAIDELNQRDFVFSGKVKNIVDPKKGKVVISSADPLTIHFDVKEAWKGINETEVLVVTERDSASCGFNFTMNEEYLVYGNMVDGKRHVSVCSKTALLSHATSDIYELGVGEIPTEIVTLDYDEVGQPDRGEVRKDPLIWIVGSIVFVILLFSIVYFVVRRNKR